MNQWLNHSHPITLQAAVILGYITAVFALIFGGGVPFLGFGGSLLINLGIGVGAFASANNKRWGYLLLAVSATLAAVARIALLFFISFSPIWLLTVFNGSIFTFALTAAVLHVQSREYQKIWFD